MSKGKFTIREISEASGVSVGTVDRYIHNRGHLSAQSVVKIQSAIARLENGIPSPGQKDTASPQKIRIGVSCAFVEPAFNANIQVAIENAKRWIGENNIEIIASGNRSVRYGIEAQLEVIRSLVEGHRVDGLLIAPYNDVCYSEILDSCVPKGIPYATLINNTLSCNRIFHIGPNNYAMGALLAKMVYLYSHTDRELTAAIISASSIVIDMQERVAGFMGEIRNSNLGIYVAAVRTVEESLITDIGRQVFDITEQLIKDYPHLDAIYLNYGYGEAAAKAIEKNGKRGQIHLVTHEISPKIASYIEKGIILCSVDQKPAQQLLNAILLMYNFIQGENNHHTRFHVAECRILTKETLPLYNSLLFDSPLV